MAITQEQLDEISPVPLDVVENEDGTLTVYATAVVTAAGLGGPAEDPAED